MTHTTKHTPGPWGRIVELGCDVYAISKDPESHTFVAECAIEEDARFIAAAPAMYEALKMARWLSNECECHESWNAPEGNLCGHCTADLAIKTALSQAEGKQ